MRKRYELHIKNRDHNTIAVRRYYFRFNAVRNARRINREDKFTCVVYKDHIPTFYIS